ADTRLDLGSGEVALSVRKSRMLPRLSLAAFVALLALPAAAPAFAATTPPGVSLRWDNCYDDGGTANKTFACNTNAGSGGRVVSFVLWAPLGTVVGTDISIEGAATSAALPAWWSVVTAGSCRPTSLSIAAWDGTNCSDWASL